jgi:hypothetical protein
MSSMPFFVSILKAVEEIQDTGYPPGRKRALCYERVLKLCKNERVKIGQRSIHSSRLINWTPSKQSDIRNSCDFGAEIKIYFPSDISRLVSTEKTEKIVLTAFKGQLPDLCRSHLVQSADKCLSFSEGVFEKFAQSFESNLNEVNNPSNRLSSSVLIGG